MEFLILISHALLLQRIPLIFLKTGLLRSTPKDKMNAGILHRAMKSAMGEILYFRERNSLRGVLVTGLKIQSF
jgi:hypothetical protein